MDELVSSDFVDHDPPPIPGLDAGLSGLKQAFESFWRSTPGTHEVLDVTGTAIYRVQDGQLAEHWGETDSLSLMQQLARRR